MRLQGNPRVTVVGAGVIGLTTAIVLQEAGYEVEILTKALPQQTTSAVAGAIWLPFLARPVEKVARWSATTYFRLQAMAGAGVPGCAMVELQLFPAEDRLPPWAGLLPAGAIEALPADRLPSNCRHGWQVQAPMIDTPVYLRYLFDRFRENEGLVRLQTLEQEADFPLEKGWVVNCTGLGARALCHDEELYPVRGQLVKLMRREGLPFLVDERDLSVPTYVFSRQDAIIAGGTAEPNEWSTETDRGTIDGILERARRLVPALADLPVIGTLAGLRPARSTVRLERVPGTRLIHHYGHGGSGFTLAWGCAGEVLQLVREAEVS